MKLENKTVEELKNICRNKKISGYSKLNKQGLINLLNNNKKGGYVVKNWMKAFSNNFMITNGTTKITKNNLAGNYYNVFVPLKEYNLDEIPNTATKNSINKIISKTATKNNLGKIHNTATKNNIIYPIINKMIFDYLIEQKKNYKNEKLKNIIQEYLPINNTSKKIDEKSVCKWWYLDSDLEFKQINGTYVNHTFGYYQTKMKNDLPPSFKDYDSFLIVETSSYI